MAAGTAPDYDNVRWGGTLRVPQEANKATLAVKKMVVVVGGGASTLTLNAEQIQASLLVITNMGSLTSAVSLPAAIPGHLWMFKNSTGSSSTCTFKVTGKSGIAVADGKFAILTCDTADVIRVTSDT